MAIEARRSAVGGPSCVCNASVRIEDLSQVGLLLLDELLQLGNLAHFLEGKDLILLVSIYGQTGRVVATILQSREAIDEGVEDELPVLLDEVVNVAKDATTKRGCVSRRASRKRLRTSGRRSGRYIDAQNLIHTT
jgi:hypothetical protein